MFKYIYFNHMNLAQQTTVHMDLQKRAGINIPQEIMRLLSDINADLTRCMLVVKCNHKLCFPYAF